MDAIRAALEGIGIFRGEILAPQDLAGFLEPDCGSELEGWGFAVPSTRAIEESFRSAATSALSIGLLQSPTGVIFLCVTAQVASAQVRLVADLADSRIRRLLSWSAEHRKLNVILRAQDAEPILAVFSVNKAHLDSLLELAKTLRPVPPTHHAVALAKAAYELTTPQCVESLDVGVEVIEVSVCTIAPDASEILAMESARATPAVY